MGEEGRGPGLLGVQHLLDGEDDVLDLRQAVVLQDFGVRHGDVDARHPADRSVQVVEGGAWREEARTGSRTSRTGTLRDQERTFHDPGTDLRPHAKLRPAALHRQQVVGLHHARLDALHIHGTDGAQVDHLVGTGGGG